MTETDIVTVTISDSMYEEAKKDAMFFSQNYGNRTRAVISDRDIIGSLAHQAVEYALEDCGVPFETRRTIREQLGQGDKYDIRYESDLIDVKGTHGVLDRWYYNKRFLVFTQQLEDPKTAHITHFCFVMVDQQERKAHIFGLISHKDFIDKSEPVTLRYENRAVVARDLVPFRKYVYRI